MSCLHNKLPSNNKSNQ